MADEPIADTVASGEPVTATGAVPIAVGAGTTLFVKNLSFSTTAEKLTQVVHHLPGYVFMRVQTKPDPARPGAQLSMGYGFVGFRTSDKARRGLKSMEDLVLDGHKLVVKWAGCSGDEADAAGATDEEQVKARTTKMIVKNVPFEATKKGICELFGAHAQLKSVRVPRKFDHRTRGSAFLEFTTRHEAECASQLQNNRWGGCMGWAHRQVNGGRM